MVEEVVTPQYRQTSILGVEASNPAEGEGAYEVNIKPDTPINVYTRFCLNTAKSKFSLVSPVADW